MGSIILNGISYTSGGADVEANPQDTPSDTLSTIGIDGVVYEIEGGGGGSDVVVDPTITSGTKIADITVDGDTSSLYTPEVSLTYAEYMALTEQEKNNGTTYYITDMDAGKVNIFAPVIYSQQEREIGVWIDNKPLYQKTMTYQFTNTNDVYHDFVPDANAYIVNVIGLIDTGGGSWTRPVPIFYNNSVSNTHARFDEGAPAGGVRLRRESGAWGATPTAIVTLQYTKTTDIEGSGLYNSLGVPTVHYSQGESVIGTWVDGKTLYRYYGDLDKSIGTSWVQLPELNTLNIATCIKVVIFAIDYAPAFDLQYDSASTPNEIIRARNATFAAKHILLEYTKTS